MLNQLLQSVKKIPASNDVENDYPLPRSSPPPAAKPLNKTRINEFAALLSSSIHLTPPSAPVSNKPKTNVVPPPVAAAAAAPLVHPDRHGEEGGGEEEQVKKHIDARYNERIDDRKNIRVKTANIKALFEEKISTANRTLSQSTEQLVEAKSAPQRKATKVKRHSTSTPMANIVIEEKPVSFNQESSRFHRPLSVFSSATTTTKNIAVKRLRQRRRRRWSPGKFVWPRRKKKNWNVNERNAAWETNNRSSWPNACRKVIRFSRIWTFSLRKRTTRRRHAVRFARTRISFTILNNRSARPKFSTPPRRRTSSNVKSKRFERKKPNWENWVAFNARVTNIRIRGNITNVCQQCRKVTRRTRSITANIDAEATNAKAIRVRRLLLVVPTNDFFVLSDGGRGKSVVTNGSSSSIVRAFVDRIQSEKEPTQARHLISTGSSSFNGDSGNVSQEEHDDDQERYFDKIQRIKRAETEVTIHFPLARRATPLFFPE